MAYTTIDDPSQYFQTDLHTGDGSGSTETFDGNSDLQPDFLWYKSRSVVGDHGWVDTLRSKPSSNSSFKILRSNSDSAEISVNSGSDFTAMNSDGYTYGSVHYLDLATNNSQNTVWGWKCNGGTTATNNDGSYTSTVQANTTAGFSIVKYGDATSFSASTPATVGHGLGKAPKWIVIKNLDGTRDWGVHHRSNGAGKIMYLNLQNAVADSTGFDNGTLPTSSVFTVNTLNVANGNNLEYIAYCFAEIQGYSKFGSYTGNGNADGAFVYTGFAPAWVMIKRTDSSSNGNWFIIDNKRSTSNVRLGHLRANQTNAENTSTNQSIDFLANGFKLRDSNTSLNNGTYIYMAFAEHPFVSSKGVPVTAR
jgi:hypothetical protein